MCQENMFFLCPPNTFFIRILVVCPIVVVWRTWFIKPRDYRKYYCHIADRRTYVISMATAIECHLQRRPPHWWSNIEIVIWHQSAWFRFELTLVQCVQCARAYFCATIYNALFWARPKATGNERNIFLIRITQAIYIYIYKYVVRWLQFVASAQQNRKEQTKLGQSV